MAKTKDWRKAVVSYISYRQHIPLIGLWKSSPVSLIEGNAPPRLYNIITRVRVSTPADALRHDTEIKVGKNWMRKYLGDKAFANFAAERLVRSLQETEL